MQLLAYIDAVEKVIAELHLKELIAILDSVLNGPTNVALKPEEKERFSSVIFSMSHGLVSLRSNPETGSLIESLSFAQILEPSVLARLMTRFRTANGIADIQSGVERLPFWQLYWGAKSLVDTQAQLQSLLVAPKLNGAQNDEGILELEVLDYDGLGIPWPRLEEVVLSLGRLYAGISRQLGSEDLLRLAYADSGSDLGLGLIGKKLGIEAIRSLFRDGWQQIRFWREAGFDRRIDSLSKGLGFVAEVRLKAANGQVDAEDAARLERSVIVEMTKLMGAGVSLRERETYAPIPRKDLIAGARDMRLLGKGDEASASEPPAA